MEWVEVEAPTVDQAIATALSELGLSTRDEAQVEVLREAKAGFLGIGAQNAIVKVLPTPKEKSSRGRRRSRKSRSGGSEDGSKDGGQSDASHRGAAPAAGERPAKGSSTKGGDSRSGGNGRGRSQSSSRGDSKPESGGSNPRKSGKQNRPKSGSDGRDNRKKTDEKDTRPEEADIEEQAKVAGDFLKGLLGAFGLEGDVATRIEDDVLYIEVTGDQTEALVGPKGSVMQSVHEITRTVVQRKTYGAPRMRLDIAGYAERRREALTIYARKLAEKVTTEGTEVMLEPMNAADRKVVHDAVTDVEGVRSFSEGEDPNRAVVLAPED